MKPTILLLLVFVLPVSVSAQATNGLDRTATSSIETGRDKNGKPVVRTINRRFTFIDLPTAPLPGALLLLEEFRYERQLGAEAGNGVVKADAFFAQNWTRKAWTIEQAGDEGGMFNEFYRVTKYGCCASIATSFFFNLENGKRVFSATGELSSVIVPNTGLYRYVAYHSQEAIIAPFEDHDTALLQYGSATAVIWKLAIHGKDTPLARIKFQYEGKIVETDSLMLWGVDGKKHKSSLSNFAIVLSLMDENIILPIVNDEPDLKKAIVPPRYRVEIVK